MSDTTPVRSSQAWEGEIQVAVNHARLAGRLEIPGNAHGLVLFAHGSGSSRHSPRNRAVARALFAAGLATLLFDLLTAEEESTDAVTGQLRFDVRLLASRLRRVTRWVMQDDRTAALRIGYFGSSTGAAAALIASTAAEFDVGAVVSRGGRPDLAETALRLVTAPTLLIVGGADEAVVSLNRQAYVELPGVKRLEIVPDATHRFEEPGALERVAELAAQWFVEYLPAQGWHP